MGLDFENLAGFYNNLGFDYVYDPDRESSDFKDENSIHTWGVDERVAFKRMTDWVEKDPGAPFFVQFLSNTTHHPYEHRTTLITVSKKMISLAAIRNPFVIQTI